MNNKDQKLDALSKKTLIRQRAVSSTTLRQWHEHPQTGEVIVVDVTAGEPDEVIDIIPRQKRMAYTIKLMEITFNKLQQYHG